MANTDLRVRCTQEMLGRAFLELLAQKPLNRITVKELCDKAEINRGTFYKHYLDCYDLMEKLEDQALQRFDELLAASDSSGEAAVLLSLLYTLREQRETLRGVMRNREGTRFIQKLTQRYLQYMEKHAPGQTLPYWTQEPHRTALHIFLAGGCEAVITQWVRGDMKEPPEKAAQEILALVALLHQGTEEETKIVVP